MAIIYRLYSFGRLPRAPVAIRLLGQRPEVIPLAIVRYWISIRFNQLLWTSQSDLYIVRVWPVTRAAQSNIGDPFYLYYYTCMCAQANDAECFKGERSLIYFPAGRDANSDHDKLPKLSRAPPSPCVVCNARHAPDEVVRRARSSTRSPAFYVTV